MNDEAINVSALNQYAYCPRRYSLIYLESEFTNNVHTSRGNAEHERVDQSGWATTPKGARAEYALPVWSERLGLIGKCDVVEFLADGTPYPVEYKHGARKKWINDDLQLAAQALCLEEMTGKPVLEGAIYHFTSRRRREVLITAALREEVVQTIAAIREIVRAGKLPKPVNDKRCDQCSLKEICQPAAVSNVSAIAKAHRVLLDPES